MMDTPHLPRTDAIVDESLKAELDRLTYVSQEFLRTLRSSESAPGKSRLLERVFTGIEMAEILGIDQSYIRQKARNGNEDGWPSGAFERGKRIFSAGEIRAFAKKIIERNPRRRITDDGQQAIVVSVSNLKGGSGKSTSSVHLAQFLAIRGARVLLVDLDAQASASHFLGFSPEELIETGRDIREQQTITQYLDGMTAFPDLPISTYWPGLDLIPGGIDLAEVEFNFTAMQVESARATQRLMMFEAGEIATPLTDDERHATEFLFTNILHEGLLSIKDNYDVIILDTHPDAGFLTMNALTAADIVLTPVPTTPIDLAATREFIRILSAYMASVNPSLEIKRERYGSTRDVRLLKPDRIIWLPTRHDENRSASVMVHSLMKQLFGDALMPAILEGSGLSQAVLRNATLYEAPKDLDRKTWWRMTANFNSSLTVIESVIRDIAREKANG